jgi:malic enzyme
MDAILAVAAEGDVRLIVVTDNERILGLGDLGAGGIAIPVGKLALYTAAAGIHPSRTLPVSLDVGTDRQELLDDPLYLGYRAPRLRGPAYDEVIEAFAASVRRVFPAAVVQWEDFKQHNAVRVLERYRRRLSSFNDDVQGTGATVVGGLIAARRAQGGLAADRFLVLGAGAAAVGIATLLRKHLGLETGGFGEDGTEPVIVLMDSRGVVHGGRPDLAVEQRPLAVDAMWVQRAGLSEAAAADPVSVARAMRATVLLGATGCRGAFSESLVRAVGEHAANPIVLPLSNPTERSEATPEDVAAWTGGRAIIATGSPFRDLAVNGRCRVIGQANNVFVFPGVGLAAVVAEAREITDEAFLVAARALAAMVSPERLAAGAIYPPISDLRRVARGIAIALVRHLRDSGYGRQFRDEEIEPAVERAMWWPEYLPLSPA